MLRFLLICSLLTAQYSFAQQPRFMVQAQLGFMNHFNFSQVSNPTLGRMHTWSCSPSFGAEVTYTPVKNWRMSLGGRYYYRSQKIVQSDFQYYLTDDSRTYMRYKYENLEIPLMIWRALRPNLWCGAGAALSYFDLIVQHYGNHYALSGQYTGNQLNIGFKYSEQPLGRWHQQTNILFGLRGKPWPHQYSRLNVGMLFTLRTGKMPDYHYEQLMITDDQGTIHSEVYYTSTQHSAEVRCNFPTSFSHVRHERQSSSLFSCGVAVMGLGLPVVASLKQHPMLPACGGFICSLRLYSALHFKAHATILKARPLHQEVPKNTGRVDSL